MLRRTLAFCCLAALGALCDRAIQAAFWPLAGPTLIGRVGQNLVLAQASPDGKRVAGLQRLGQDRWSLTVWDTQSQRELISNRPVVHPPATTNPLAWSADGRWLAVGGAGEVNLWDIEAARAHLLKAEYLVREVRFSGDWLLARSDNALFVWNWKSQKLLKRIAQDHLLTAAISQEAGLVAAASLQDSIRLYGLPQGRLLKTLPAGPATVNLEFVAGGERLASAFRNRSDRSTDCSILYDWRQGRAEARVPEPDLVGFSVSLDGSRLLTRNPAGGHIWDHQGRCLQEFELPGLLTDSLSPSGEWVASHDRKSGQVIVWKPLSSGESATLPSQRSPFQFGFLGGGRVQVVDGACSVYQLP